MKVTIDNTIDSVYLKFNDNKIEETISLEKEIKVDIDASNKVVGIEILHYSKLIEWTNELLADNNLLLLDENCIVFNMHQGYLTAWFDIRDIKEEYTICKYYLEGESIEYDLVKNYIQDEVDITIKYMD